MSSVHVLTRVLPFGSVSVMVATFQCRVVEKQTQTDTKSIMKCPIFVGHVFSEVESFRLVTHPVSEMGLRNRYFLIQRLRCRGVE